MSSNCVCIRGDMRGSQKGCNTNTHGSICGRDMASHLELLSIVEPFDSTTVGYLGYGSFASIG